MSDDVMAHLEQAVIVRPGDTLILRLAESARPEDMARLQEALEERLPEVKAVILGGVEELAVYRPERRPETRVELDYDRIGKAAADGLNRALSRDQGRRRSG